MNVLSLFDGMSCGGNGNKAYCMGTFVYSVPTQSKKLN